MGARVDVDLDVVIAKAAFFVGQGAIDESLELLDLERFELKNLGARDERAVDVEKWIVSRGPNQPQVSAFNVREQNILLRFVEMVDLVHEQDRLSPRGP